MSDLQGCVKKNELISVPPQKNHLHFSPIRARVGPGYTQTPKIGNIVEKAQPKVYVAPRKTNPIARSRSMQKPAPPIGKSVPLKGGATVGANRRTRSIENPQFQKMIHRPSPTVCEARDRFWSSRPPGVNVFSVRKAIKNADDQILDLTAKLAKQRSLPEKIRKLESCLLHYTKSLAERRVEKAHILKAMSSNSRHSRKAHVSSTLNEELETLHVWRTKIEGLEEQLGGLQKKFQEGERQKELQQEILRTEIGRRPKVVTQDAEAQAQILEPEIPEWLEIEPVIMVRPESPNPYLPNISRLSESYSEPTSQDPRHPSSPVETPDMNAVQPPEPQSETPSPDPANLALASTEIPCQESPGSSVCSVELPVQEPPVFSSGSHKLVDCEASNVLGASMEPPQDSAPQNWALTLEEEGQLDSAQSSDSRVLGSPSELEVDALASRLHAWEVSPQQPVTVPLLDLSAARACIYGESSHEISMIPPSTQVNEPSELQSSDSDVLFEISEESEGGETGSPSPSSSQEVLN